MNLQAIAHNRATDAALRIYGKVLEAVRSDRLVHDAMQRVGDELFVQGRRYDLSHFDRILVCGVGKAAPAMTEAALEVVGRVDDVLVVTKSPSSSRPGRDGEGVGGGEKRFLYAAHPIPDETSLTAGEAILQMARSVDEHTFVLVLLSGGTSSLVEAPIEGIALEDLQATNEYLLRSGQPIEVMNAIRSRLSRIKAGGLARAFAPATVVVLVLSDVIGNEIATVGSGPFLAPRPGSDVSVRFTHATELPESVRHALQAPRGIELGEQATVHHHVIGSVSLAVHAAVSASEEIGIEPLAYSDPLQGEAREMARKIVRHAAKVIENRKPEPFCMIFGGETTVTLGRSSGQGGRCQEMALAVAPRIERMPDCAFLAAGTDGSDGPTDAAGASADPETVARATLAGQNYHAALSTHDSYRYLESSGNLIFTGPTDSNVNDIALFVSL